MLKHLLQLCNMGGYGVYVWPSYILLLTLISWQVFAALKKNLAIQNKLKQDLWSGSNSDQQT